MEPFIGTTTRGSTLLTKILQKYLYYESKNIDKPIVFLFHPNEGLDIGEEVMPTKRTKIRPILKLRNLGWHSLKLLDEILRSAKEYGFEFLERYYAEKTEKIKNYAKELEELFDQDLKEITQLK